MITSTYEYITLEESITETVCLLRDNILDFSINFKSNENFLEGELYKIAKELESAAQYFGAQQSLSGTNLLSHTKAIVNGRNIEFTNNAQDKYGRFYAGHIEYGHRLKGTRGFVPARPFMRPALYAVSKASRGELEDVLGDMLMTIFRDNGRGYQGFRNLKFGHELGIQYHHYAKSNNVAKQLSSMNLYDRHGNFLYATGKDLGLVGLFNKRMGDWSLKRDSNSSLERKKRESAGFKKNGRNAIKQKQTNKLLKTIKNKKKSTKKSNDSKKSKEDKSSKKSKNSKKGNNSKKGKDSKKNKKSKKSKKTKSNSMNVVRINGQSKPMYKGVVYNSFREYSVAKFNYKFYGNVDGEKK